ncbi:Peptidyl-prolyl cis-trans isomerase 1 [Chionoecetes opilio]|uniref:Peptidyl-prolyl cis-trans isomerase 1 n=1 Tax=Chionoecetes opilio TaxID=41210 RepID=A0A8J4Y931_CHIOP|nr:Peptidyl-prolyl cis-trans isomerase 1 [Chionoecetes opilio]
MCKCVSMCKFNGYNEVKDLQDEDFCIVFLDVSWRGDFQGRVYIVLLDHAGRTRQFKALCTGQLGPSYVGTRFLEVSQKGEIGEQIWGGDYERNDGTGGAALPGMDRGRRNNQDVVTGLVAGFYFSGYGQDHSPSQFTIYTRDWPGYIEMSSIGTVIGGMDVVKTITRLGDTREAFISDCGLLLCH